MAHAVGRFLRENAFLVAAVSLPLVVALFFIASATIPRWLVAPPAYDLLLRTDGRYAQTARRMAVEYAVRDGRVEATIRPIPADTYLNPGKLFLFDHETMTAREVPVDLPREIGGDDLPRTIEVDALAGRRVLAQAEAPDGYRFDTGARRGPGLVGEIFGMGRYDRRLALVKDGRVVPITLPEQSNYANAYALGWVLDERR